MSQWSYLLKNIGVWQGSFTQFSPDGVFVKNTPTEVTLESLNEDKTIRLTVNRLEGDNPPHVNEFTYLNRNIFLFEEGHFAKGSQQFSPFSIFGAEYGFLIDDRRLRMVQLFDRESKLEPITLIREFRANGNGVERSSLTIEQLEGEWQGEAFSLYPDWRNSQPYPTYLTIKKEENKVIQTLKTPELNLTSKGIIEGNTITFSENNHDIRVLLLPDGASSTTPLKIENRQHFFLECGWLVEPNLRLRLIRQYDNEGRWTNVTLIKEKKVN
ncbi:DUF3598 family protein [Geminocystis sp. NIES-3709]|uniref:DUF3598 family protein n=1 Tax=Geminocystis sp. NIES-3709 TaxID=1617448 RepID=UPI0005FC7DAE|nr:DUF3598 family protein [Geminocystis sp. NIES-3709]BAQ66661.1 hypothetical protein GM3709_3426 [Geminocystis sp. NIES-3709]